jgi:hypothetical protein
MTGDANLATLVLPPPREAFETLGRRVSGKDSAMPVYIIYFL